MCIHPCRVLLYVLLSLVAAEVSALTHTQYLPYATLPGATPFFGTSYDSGASAQYLYVSLHDVPLPLQDPQIQFSAYQLNSATGQYSAMAPFAAAGAGALYTSAKYVKIGLANPSGTLLQHFYYLSDYILGDRIGWASIGADGKIAQIAGVLVQGQAGVAGLNNATDLAITPGLTQSYLYTTGEAEDVVGIFSRNMTTGALSYTGRIGPELSPALSNPKSLAVNPSGSRLSVVSDNRLSIFIIGAGGALTLTQDLTGACFQNITDAVLTTNDNVLFVSTIGGIRKVTRNPLTLVWGCASFAPAFWENGTVRIAEGQNNGEITASIHVDLIDNDLNSVATLDWNGASVVVTSEFYSVVGAQYYQAPIRATKTKDNQVVIVGNKGFLGPLNVADGFNVFRFEVEIFKNGFE